MQKITARTYQRWMAIPASHAEQRAVVLTGTDEANARLRQVAVDSGLAAERIVFAEKKANPEHLARYPLANLFLDSFPYGAHTTASDSMWMGVPILTFPGRSFAARVCADLVRAAGIGEMVCNNSADDYVERAVAFGSDPDSLGADQDEGSWRAGTTCLCSTPRSLSSTWRMPIGRSADDLIPQAQVPGAGSCETSTCISRDDRT